MLNSSIDQDILCKSYVSLLKMVFYYLGKITTKILKNKTENIEFYTLQ